MKKPVISCRLPERLVPFLEEKAKARKMTVSSYVTELILKDIGEDEEELTSERLRLLQKQMEELKSLLAAATEAILIVSGSKDEYSPEKAKEWVNSHLKRIK